MIVIGTDVAAHALGIPRKTLDNILSREARALMKEGRRGKKRRIDFDTLEHIAIALLLGRDLAIPIATGLRLAAQVSQMPDGDIPVSSFTSIRCDLPRLRATLEAAIIDALDGFVPARRGRPSVAN